MYFHSHGLPYYSVCKFFARLKPETLKFLRQNHKPVTLTTGTNDLLPG